MNAVLHRINSLETGSRIVRLQGPPGSGHTPVAKSVAASLDREGRLSASFFFDKTGERKGAASADLFVTTLASQLAEHNPLYRSAVAKIISDTPSLLRQPPIAQLDPLIIHPLQAIYTEKPKLIQPSFLVIDGVEEYSSHEDREKLMALVARLPRLPEPFHLFVTRRSDPRNKLDPPRFPTHSAPQSTSSHFAISPGDDAEGTRLSSSNDDPTILSRRDEPIDLWGLKPEEPIWQAFEGPGHVLSISFSPDGKRVVSGSWDSAIRMWDAESGKAIGEPLKGHTDWVRSVSFSSDGKCIVSGSADKTIRVWDAESGKPMGEPLRGHTDWVRSVSFSPNGKRIVSGSGDKTILLWDAGSGEAIGEPLRGHTRVVSSVSFSLDGKCIVSGSADKTIRVWDAESGKPMGEPLRGHMDWVRSVSFSPDGKHIVSGSHDGTIQVWDAESGKPIGKPLQGHTDWVRSVSFSQDGKCIISGSDDKTIRIWDAESGKPIGKPLRGHTDCVNSVSFSPDGKHIVSGSDNMTIRIWDTQLSLSFPTSSPKK